jgi:hypothetical protein
MTKAQEVEAERETVRISQDLCEYIERAHPNCLPALVMVSAIDVAVRCAKLHSIKIYNTRMTDLQAIEKVTECLEIIRKNHQRVSS